VLYACVCDGKNQRENWPANWTGLWIPGADIYLCPRYYVKLLFLRLPSFPVYSTGMVVIAVLCGGDGLADIVGRRLGGGNPLPWNPAKSWAGSIAMFFGEHLCGKFIRLGVCLPSVLLLC
jgi:dolichol kinase